MTMDLIARLNEWNERGEYDAALRSAAAAVKENDGDFALWIALGNAFYGKKMYGDAERAYKKAETLNPSDPTAPSNLAGLFFETNRFEDGLAACDEALRRAPDALNALVHRGNMLSSLNRFDEALETYERALRLSPGDDLTRFNQAYALSMTGQTDRAGEIYSGLLEKDPDNIEYLYAFASFAERTGDAGRAAEIYLRLLKLKDEPSTHVTLAGCLYTLLLADETDAVLRLTDEWLTAFPDNPVALHTLETLKNKDGAKRASAEYVTELFDAFADSFDGVLADLSYRAPEYVAEAVEKYDFPAPPAGLDLGCGTGLCGAAMRKRGIALASLTGVDLSEKMLEKAAGRGVYTELMQSDILTFLPARPAAFDVIVSSDVFTYLGELSELFAGLAAALKPKGRLAFTVSECAEKADGYVLGLSGRFRHGERYVRDGLERNGLTVESVVSVELRRELDAPVAGLLVQAVKK